MEWVQKYENCVDVIYVLSLGVWAHHDPSVVNEDIDSLLLLVDLPGALPDRLEARQVAPVDKVHVCF